MDYYIKILQENWNGRKHGWKRKKVAVLICGRCGELDREDTIEAYGKCTTCGLDYTGGMD